MVKKYEDTKIYKIVCNETGLMYIGATTKQYLSQRLASHVTAYRRHITDNNTSGTTSYKVLEAGNFNIHLLELYPCANIDEQAIRERHYISTLECVNKNIPGRTKQEYNKTEYAINKEAILIKQKAYRNNNVNKVCTRCNYESVKMKGKICCSCYNIIQNQRYHDKYKCRHIVYMPTLRDD